MNQPAAIPHPNDIAIVGMSCRFPDANDVSVFWRNLEQGVESISFFSEAELLAAGVDPALLADPAYVRAGAVIDDIDCFDAAFFGYSPREASLIEPQQRIFLECAWEALERAGYTPASHGRAIGVFAGSAMNGYLIYHLATRPDVAPSLFDFQIQIGNDKDYLTTRVSYKLNLTGPSINIQSACSTSLVAVHVACQSLLNGECNLALAGGISIAVPHRIGYLYQEGGVNSADGHCRAFDTDARGTVLGSGAGVVALKRLADALADGDHIHAVIKGSAVNNDGNAKVGYTAPSVSGQAAVVVEALAMAGLTADTIGYIETHGTGTPMGDPIEIQALTQAFRESSTRQGDCAIGSVKTNIGHMDVASGVAGLIKTALMLEHRRIPASLHYRRPNPEIDFANSPFYVNSTLAEWTQPVCRAGVSSFGLGGTNAHVLLEEAPKRAAASASRAWQLILLSARTPGALERMTERLADHLRADPAQPLADIAFTLQTGRERFAHRRMLVCRDHDGLVQALLAGDCQRGAEAVCERQNRPVVFMFPGQGAQYLGMGRELYDAEPLFRAEVDRCAEILIPHLGQDLRCLIWPAREASAAALQQTWIVQPALFVIEYALARLWISWGIRPAAMIGHSIGEYAALCLAEVMSLADALRLVAARGRLMQEMPAGSMLAVDLPESALVDLEARGLALAGVNAPDRCVLSGPTEAIAACQQQLDASGQPSHLLHTSHAFHSAMMEPILERFTAVVATIPLQAPRLPVVSNLSGTWLSATQACDPAYYARHLRHAVRFADGIGCAAGDGNPLFLEVGPGRTLGTLVQQCAASSGSEGALWSMRHPQQQEPDQAMLLATLGKLWLAGVNVDWAGFHANETRRREPLPGYPFERQRHWIEPGRLVAQAADEHPPTRATPGKRPLADWFYLPAWKQCPLPAGNTPAKGPWLLFTTGEGFGEHLAGRLQADGQAVIRVLPGIQAGWSGERRYTLDPARRADYDSLLAALASADQLPKSVLHAWNLAPAAGDPDRDSFTRAQDLGFNSLLYLAQALGDRDYTEALRIGVLGTGIQALTAGEQPIAERAGVLAACIVIAQEYANVDSRCYDLQPPAVGSAAEQALGRQILREIGSDAPDAIVAYRDGVRWVQHYQPRHLKPVAGPPARLRPQGVYLISGGLGAIGYALAEDLARSVQARLILTGRSALPAAAEWDTWISTHGTGHPCSQRIARVRALEGLGAEVLVISADVADAAAMTRALAQARSHFGHIDGVIHGAGIVAEQAFLAVQDTRPKHCAEHFRPKVDGLLVLHRLLRDDPPDFYVLLSSISAVLGGLGYAAYAAANAYLDAYAVRASRQSGPAWLSIGWDAWLSAASSGRHGMGAVVNALAMTTEEGVDAFRRILAADLGAQVLVSTSDLSTRIAQWVKRKPRDVAAAAAEAAPSVIYATAMQTAIARVWESVLGVSQIAAQDNFFDLGGDSLLLMDVIARLKAGYGVVLNPREIMFQTLAQLAAQCEERQAAQCAAVAAPATAPATAVGAAPEAERKGGLFGALKRKIRG